MKTLIINDTAGNINYQHTQLVSKYECPLTIDDVFETFKELPEKLFIRDAKNIISFILNDNSEISLSDYTDKLKNKIVFLKITTDTNLENADTILLSVKNNHDISADSLAYIDDKPNKTHIDQTIEIVNSVFADVNHYTHTSNDDRNIAIIDVDGYGNTENMLSDNYQVINYVHRLKYKLVKNHKKSAVHFFYRGYTPAAGEIDLICKYIDMINYIFKYINAEEIDIKNSKYWTSTVCNDFDTWMLRKGLLYKYEKQCLVKVLPLFKRIK